jgi:hypothetical protein
MAIVRKTNPTVSFLLSAAASMSLSYSQSYNVEPYLKSIIIPKLVLPKSSHSINQQQQQQQVIQTIADL